MTRAPATAKINLALVVGPRRADGKHEVETVLQRIDLADRVAVQDAPELRVDGFPEDTLVADALRAVAAAAGSEPRWRARIWKRIPVATGLGGGSSDAATALGWLTTARQAAGRPLVARAGRGSRRRRPVLPDGGPAARKGRRVASSSRSSCRRTTGSCSCAAPRRRPRPRRPRSTAASTSAAPPAAGRGGGKSSATCSAACGGHATSPRCLRTTSPPRRWPRSCAKLGAFRADVSGAGPAVYGLFTRSAAALARAGCHAAPPVARG